jgi:hypothetical protein
MTEEMESLINNKKEEYQKKLLEQRKKGKENCTEHTFITEFWNFLDGLYREKKITLEDKCMFGAMLDDWITMEL